MEVFILKHLAASKGKKSQKPQKKQGFSGKTFGRLGIRVDNGRPIKIKRLKREIAPPLNEQRLHIIHYDYRNKWLLDKAKEAKESEEKERLAPRGLLPKDTPELQLKASPSPPSEDSPEEEVSRGSHPSSMTTQGTSLRDSLRVSSEMPWPTLNTPEEKPSLPWTSFTLWRDKAEPSTVSEVDFYSDDALTSSYQFFTICPYKSVVFPI